MIQDEDPLFRQLPFLAPDRLRLLIAHAGGLLAHQTSHTDAAIALDRVSHELREQDPRCSMRGILASVAHAHDVSLEDLRGPSRKRRFTFPRQEAMWRIRQVRVSAGGYRYSLPQIGEFLGRDHATVLHGVRTYEARLAAQRVAA